MDKYKVQKKAAEQEQPKPQPEILTREEIVRRQLLERNMRIKQQSHSRVNFNYLDLYEEQSQYQKKMEKAMKEEQRLIEGEKESNRPAFFQRDEKMEELRKKQLVDQGIDQKAMEEYEAYKKMQEKTEVDFNN